jgi:hypothetical protein
MENPLQLQKLTFSIPNYNTNSPKRIIQQKAIKEKPRRIKGLVTQHHYRLNFKVRARRCSSVVPLCSAKHICKPLRALNPNPQKTNNPFQ